MTVSKVPAAASPWVADRVAGPRRRAEVIARGPQALYVDVDGDCLGVLARGAVALPNGLRTTLHRLPEFEGPVLVGAGRVSLPGHDVVPSRIVDPTVPRLGGLPAWRPAVPTALPTATLRALAAGQSRAALDLLGLGPGLTPAGDDVLAGWLVARYAADRPTGPVAEAVRSKARARTTLLSATLLDRAAHGEAAPACRDLLLALHAGSAVDAALAALLRVGHTSGAALALGIGLGLENAA